MAEGKLPPEHSLDDVKLKIKKSYTESNPQIRSTTQAALKEGPRAYKIATLLEIINPKTQDFHHYSLKIDQIDKTKSAWTYKPDKSVRLEGKEPDEIKRLYYFLHAAYENGLGEASGELHVISAADHATYENILKAVPGLAGSDKLGLVGELISKLDKNSSSISSFVKAFEGGNDETIQHIATASRLLEYSKSLNELKELVSNPNSGESAFQKHLEKHTWMFGSEYSELLSRRTWTRDDNLDYMLRKTVDGYLEIVEIKTAFSEALFLHDNSHDSYYPSSKLSPVIGQVIRYIEEVERSRDSILAKDKADTLKIRARVIVGRDGDEQHQAALRNFNAHLHQIEIITYDQLVRIAERVLSMFDVKVASEQDDALEDEIPF